MLQLAGLAALAAARRELDATCDAYRDRHGAALDLASSAALDMAIRD
jgi:hypothetical protein